MTILIFKSIQNTSCPLTGKIKLPIPVIFQVASLLATLTHPGHRAIYAPGDSLPCRRDAS
ncbi:hypothetical protein CKY10_06980 [Photorhabdus sp. HUG-39]|nr:hypothetical protein CKY10_06980 [Photorhabdus sp. HUG-39]